MSHQHDHSHEHDHHDHQDRISKLQRNQFEEAFEQFETPATAAEIDKELAHIFDHYSTALNTDASLKLIHSCIDLTTLEPTDDVDTIYNLVQKVNDLDDTNPEIPPVASICVYPPFVKSVSEQLTADGVRVTSVAGGFPSAQTFMEIKVAEIALAIADGADEIDIVLPLGAFLNGNYTEVKDQLEEQRAAAKDRVLKVIIETGVLQSPENIHRASILSLYCGADFIKTSTGKGFPGASYAACYTMARVLRTYYDKFGKKRGLKLSGGIRTTEEAIKYLSIVKAILGDEWLTPELLRFGASSLEGSILKSLM